MRYRRQRKSIPILGAGAAVLLHGLLLAPVMLGGAPAPHPRLPEAVGAAANSGSPGEASTERLILIDLGAATRPLPDAIPPASLAQLAAAPTLLQILGPDSLPLKPLVTSEHGEANEPSAADLIARTQLIGIYEGQIRARIERAWRRPRTPLAEGLFRCRVQVWQDARGNVQRVVLQQCEGTPEWFDSMVNAVKAASPLPAPPNPEVFTESFQMNFASVTYREGADEQGFEPVQPALLAASSRAAGVADEPGSAMAERSVMPASGDVILRSEGNRIEWSSASGSDLP